MANYGKPLAVRFWGRMDKQPNGCWLWTGGGAGNGYGQFQYRMKKYGAHRFAWIDTHGPIADDIQVCHKCDVPLCCNPDHLFLGTCKDNTQDAFSKGRRKGLRTRWKLTEDQVREIRALYPALSMSQLGRNYGVTCEVISRIIHRKAWKAVV